MNIRLIIVSVIIAFGLGVILTLRVSTAEPEMTEEQRKAHEFMGMEFVDGKPVRVREPAIKQFPPSPDHYEGMTAEQKEDAILLRKKNMAEASKELYRDLDHYYKIIDQNDQPVSGVEIYLNSRGFTYSGSLITGYSKRTIKFISDNNGNAHLQSRDTDFAVKFVKDGYKFTSGNLNNEDIVETTAVNPQIIRAYKIPAAEMLAQGEAIRRGGIYQFVPDGRTVSINLERNILQSNDQPDMFLRMTRRMSPQPAWDEYLDWEATIEVPQGGLIKTDDEMMFEAPESGYKQTWTIKRSQIDSKRIGRNREDLKFYIKARNGQLYAAVEISLSPTYGSDTTEASADITVVFNAQGSRNLYLK